MCRAAPFVVVILAVMTACSGSSSPPISVSLSPSSAQALDQSQSLAITATVANDSSSKGVSWSLTGTGALSGSTGPSVTYLTPSVSLTAPQQATVTATSVVDATKSTSVQITVNPYPQIPILQTLASGTVGVPYNQMIQLIGGTAPFQWSIYNGPIPTGNYVGGAVPNGLTLNASTGVISGTPTGGGTWYFEATVTDATGVNLSDGLLSIQINPSASVANPVPFLNQTLVPTAVAPGSSGFALSVSGTGFVSGATINFNGTPLTTTFVDNEHLTAMVPATNVANAGTAAVTVVNPAPGGGQSNVVYFQVAAPEAMVSFAAAQNSPLQIYSPFGITAGDFNQDGKPDLAIASVGSVDVMLGKGNGTFTAASGSPVLVPSPPYDDFASPDTGPAIAVGDFNSSGHLGLAVGLFQNEAAGIFFGSGNGTLTPSGTLANLPQANTMAATVADFNGDGNLDMVAVNTLNGVSPVVLLGYGDGAFNNIEQNFQIEGISLAAGDFNGDGKLDLVIGGAAILLGNGDGTFSQGASLNVGDFVTVADFNGDGKLDLAVCNSGANTVTILLGDGNGNFAPAGSPIIVGNQPEAIITGDFNNDGKLDLVVGNFVDNTVTLLLGNGDGTFTQASSSPYPVGIGPAAIAAADFNGDGKLDLAVANISGNTVSVLLQQ